MKVMVVFCLPEGAGLPYCSLSDLAFPPSEMSTYVFENKRYKLVSSVEILGRNPDGSRLSANAQLMKLLVAVSPRNPLTALSQLVKMRNVGEPSAKDEIKSPNGLILKSVADLFEKADHVVMLNMKYLGDVQNIDEDALLRGLGQGQAPVGVAMDANSGGLIILQAASQICFCVVFVSPHAISDSR